MLATIGVADMNELWQRGGITTAEPKLDDVPAGMSEYEVCRCLSGLAETNAHQLICFVGSGFYDHIIPAVVSEITSRGEFYTSYTPYQPEASQGTLQAMFEYQSAICPVDRDGGRERIPV